MRRSPPAVLAAAAALVRAWQEDVRPAAGRVLPPVLGDLLPAVHAGVLLEPIDLAALIGAPGRASSPGDPSATPAADDGDTAEPGSAPRPPRMPPRRAAPPSAASPLSDAGPPASLPASLPARSPQRWPGPARRWPVSPERLPAPMPPGPPGAGAARLAVVLQRYAAQEAIWLSASAAADRLTLRVPPGGTPPRSDRARPEPRRREPPPPASAREPRVVVPLKARSATSRRRLDADARGRTALASVQDAVDGRLRRWSQGIDVPPRPASGRAAAGAARPGRPHATRPASAGYRGTPEGAPGDAGSSPAGRRRGPAAEGPASQPLTKLIDLVEQAVGDLAAVERRLAELGAREAPEVQWLDDDELAGRLQGILARQARQRGIDLS